VGVTKSLKTDSRPLERKPTTSFKNLFYAVMMGAGDEDTCLSLANRLARINQEMNDVQREKFKELAKGVHISDVIHDLLNPFNPDKVETEAKVKFDLQYNEVPTEEQLKQTQQDMIKKASFPLNGNLYNLIEHVRKSNEQIIDSINLDELNFAGWNKDGINQNETVIGNFKHFLEEHKDEITALKIFYSQPYNRRQITYDMLNEVLELIKQRKPGIVPYRVWEAYEKIEKVKTKCPKHELTALVSLIRRVVDIDKELVSFETVVNNNFKDWIFRKNAGPKQFSKVQMNFLYMIRDHIITSMHFESGDFENIEQGGLARAYNTFGKNFELIIDELNEALVV